MTFSAVHRPAAIPTGRGDRSRLWVTGGKTPSEYNCSELPQVADIARSAFFHHLASPHVSQITEFWVQANSRGALTQQCREIIQNRLALVREQSVSVGHRRQPLPG